MDHEPWDVELPESPEHHDVRHEYELRRAQATAAGFERLEVLGPVIVEAKVSADPMAGASLALSLQPERAELVGQQADVVRTLLNGHHSRLAHTDTPEARKKRRQRTGTGTLRCFGRGERKRAVMSDEGAVVRFVSGPGAESKARHSEEPASRRPRPSRRPRTICSSCGPTSAVAHAVERS